MYFLYIGISTRHDKVERILSCIFTAMCYMLKYIYIGRIAKRRGSPVFAFNVQTRPNTLPDLVRVTVNLLNIGFLYKGHFKRRVLIKPG